MTCKITQSAFNIIVTFNIATLFVISIRNQRTTEKQIDNLYELYYKIYDEIQPDFYKKTPEEGLYDALLYFNIQHPDIVYSQAILETGNFKSKLCKEHNNLFGLYNSYKFEFYRYNHWVESVIAYKEKIQNKYKVKPPNEEYYKFLKNIGYATDPIYIEKLKRINESK